MDIVFFTLYAEFRPYDIVSLSFYSHFFGHMARYTKASIQALREQADIVDIISKYVPLKKAGAYYKGCCPFHDEKTPSFTVHKGTHSYHCFGCGAHGDVISFLMQHEKLDFQQALHFLAERTGVGLVLAEEQSQAEIEEDKKKARLRACNEEAMLFFHALLLHSPLAEEGRRYLQGRKIVSDFVSLFTVGYAPPSREGILIQHLTNKGYKSREMEEAGLVSHGREFFSERIMFPILDARGFVIGFSGRKWKEETPGGKYINTPETLLFKKSRVFFGISYSKRRMAKERLAILVEGQIDALQLIYAGFQMTVATLGTAFGEGHVDSLRAIGVEQVYLAFDQDLAGLKSAKKAGQLLMKKGIDVKVVTFHGVKDPDELLQKGGPSLFYDEMLQAKNFIEFLVLLAKKGSDFSNPADKQREVEEIKSLIYEWNNPILIHESIAQLSRLTGVPEALLKEEVHSILASPKPATQQVIEKKKSDDALEAELMKWLFFSLEHSQEVARLAREKFLSTELLSPLFQRLYVAFLDMLENKKPLLLISLLEQFDTDELSSCKELFSENTIRLERAKQAVVELMNKLKERNWRRKRDAIRNEMVRLSTFDEEKSIAYSKELAALGLRPPVVV